jgi:pimeloyl-ACP methyl ester carboxylesterase
MSEPTLRHIEANGIRIRIAEDGPEDGPVVLLLHGWPESWYSWRHQLPALATAGYRAIAPDMRGYGETDAPEARDDYDVEHLLGDAIGTLDAVGADQAVIVGHDWGSILAWQFALLRPDRFRAVAGMSVPYTGRQQAPPTQGMRAAQGDNFFYILYFQEPGVAEAEFDADPRGFLQRVYVGMEDGGGPGLLGGGPERAPGWLATMPAPRSLPDWLSQDELDYYIGEFARAGFRGGINYYRNFDRNWELTPQLAGVKVEQPALFIAGENDGVIAMFGGSRMAGAMGAAVADLRDLVLVPDAGHWVQQERPDEVNAPLLKFLDGLD